MSNIFSNMIEPNLINSVNDQMREIPVKKSSKVNSKQSNGKLINGNNNKNLSINSDSSSSKIGSLEEQFKAATNAIQNLPKNGPFQPSNEMLLKFYGYYKQAVSGPCNTNRPSIFKVVERAKWDAWNSVKNLTKDEAMYNYIEEVKKIIETMPHNEHVQKLIDIIGPFYEYVDDNQEEEEEEQETKNDQEVAKTNLNKSIDESTVLIKSTTTMIESFDNIGKNMFDSSYNKNDEKIPQVNGGNVYVNGVATNPDKTSKNQASNFSDDEEDYCDTSDYLSEHDLQNQSLKRLNGDNQIILKPKALIKNGYNNDENIKLNGNGFNDYNHNNLFLLNNSSFLPRINAKSNLYNGNELDIMINKFGGETNYSSGGITYQQSSLVRSSRPSSSMSNTGSYPRGTGNNSGSGGAGGGSGGGGSGGGGGGSGGNDGNNFIMSHESNRQILLLLLRLQQDTNNVLTRLSYLETTVMSIQSNLQMNRLENSIQLNHNTNNQQVGSAFSLVNNNSTHNSQITDKQTSFLFNFIRSIDWKTVAIAVIWPFIIRLIFFFLKKVRLVIKFRRIRP